MATVALIGTRMDLYAVLYGVWLCVLVIMNRKKLAKIWGIFQVFIVMLIPIQYAMAVGLPPALCIGKKHIHLLLEAFTGLKLITFSQVIIHINSEQKSKVEETIFISNFMK